MNFHKLEIIVKIIEYLLAIKFIDYNSFYRGKLLIIAYHYIF